MVSEKRRSGVRVPTRCRLVWLVALVALLPSPGLALEVVVGNVSVEGHPNLPVDGFIEVYVRFAPEETPPDLSGWQAAVYLDPPATGVNLIAPFAEPTASPEHPPLIVENFVPDFGGDNGADRASATAFLSSGTTPFVDEAGLMRIPFRLDPGTVTTIAVRLDEDLFAGTVLVDALGAVIPFTAIDGTISVFPRVPALGPIGGLLLVGLLATAGAIARR